MSKLLSIQFIICLLYLLPLNLTVATVGDKPVNLSIPDFSWIVIPFAFALKVTISRHCFFSFCMFIIYAVIGIFGSIFSGRALGPIVSAANFFLPSINILVGYFLYRRYRGSLINAIPFAFSVVVVVVFASDMLLGNFPRGCHDTGRWGGCILTFEVYGFPNSSMLFMSIMSATLFFAARSSATLITSAYFYLVVFLLGLMSVMSLSRTASAIFLLMTAFYIISFKSWKLIFMVPVVASGFLAVLYFYADSVFLKGIFLRINVAAEAGDVSNGCIDIWMDAGNLFLAQPLFGYMFQYFSLFSEFGTAHQQYIEVLFKSGLIGFIVYFFFWFKVGRGWLGLKLTDSRSRERHRKYWVQAFVIATVLTGVFLPISSYGIMANSLFCISGIFFCNF